MRGKLKVSSNVDLEGKKITVVAKKLDINLDKRTNMLTIKTETSDIDASLYETGWITFDGYIEVSLGIVSRYLGESKDYGDAVVTKDELTYSFEAVTTSADIYGGYGKGIVVYIANASGYGGYSKGVTTYSSFGSGYGGYTKGSISA